MRQIQRVTDPNRSRKNDLGHCRQTEQCLRDSAVHILMVPSVPWACRFQLWILLLFNLSLRK